MDPAYVTMILSTITLLGGGGVTVWWVKGMAERARVKNETTALLAKIDSDKAEAVAKIELDLRGEAAERFREFREEVHALRNELQAMGHELQQATAKSVRRGDRISMLVFILKMVMDELHTINPQNKTLQQARTMLDRVEDEPHQPGGSSALNKAEDTVDAAKATVLEVKAEEAKK